MKNGKIYNFFEQILNTLWSRSVQQLEFNTPRSSVWIGQLIGLLSRRKPISSTYFLACDPIPTSHIERFGYIIHNRFEVFLLSSWARTSGQLRIILIKRKIKPYRSFVKSLAALNKEYGMAAPVLAKYWSAVASRLYKGIRVCIYTYILVYVGIVEAHETGVTWTFPPHMCLCSYYSAENMSAISGIYRENMLGLHSIFHFNHHISTMACHGLFRENEVRLFYNDLKSTLLQEQYWWTMVIDCPATVFQDLLVISIWTRATWMWNFSIILQKVIYIRRFYPINK